MPDESSYEKADAYDSELDFDIDDLDKIVEDELGSQLQDLAFLEDERAKIDNPEALGKVIVDEVWKQFGAQIGLDMTDETLIQKYDRENPETYAQVKQEVMQDPRYKAANKEMSETKKAGELVDAYTGKTMARNDSANLDHVVSRKEIFDNQRRKQAGLKTEDLANKDENLQPTNESLNKSMQDKTIQEYIDPSTRAAREADLKAKAEKAKQKIDASDMSEVDKRVAKEKVDKRLQDKLDADADLMAEADKTARKAIKKDITRGAVKQVGKKAAMDALKMVAVTALFALLKDVINALVRFFKTEAKTFNDFLGEMKRAFTSFFSHITNYLQTGAAAAIGTVISEIFGPIVSLFRKLASLIKQGVNTVIDAVKYLTSKEHKDEPFGVKVAQVGKIVTVGLVAGGALFLGELFEKILLTVPGMQIQIPLMGTLANFIGLFLASLLSGVVGAIVINFIDKMIAKRQLADNQAQSIEKYSEILETQDKLIAVKEAKLEKTKQDVARSILARHSDAEQIIDGVLDTVASVDDSDRLKKKNEEMSDDIDELLQW